VNVSITERIVGFIFWAMSILIQVIYRLFELV